MDDCSRDFANDGIHLSDPFSARKLHNLSKWRRIPCEGDHHTTFVADFANQTLKCHGSTESSRRCTPYECSHSNSLIVFGVKRALRWRLRLRLPTIQILAIRPHHQTKQQEVAVEILH